MPYYKVGFETGFAGCDTIEYVEANDMGEAEEIALTMMHECCYSFASEVSKDEYKENNDINDEMEIE
tara:strand:+ start:721 stop:921 length:201 start_codon:yes stop_codon:yes gene_type:complete